MILTSPVLAVGIACRVRHSVPELIKASVILEEHSDFVKNGVRSVENGTKEDVLIYRAYAPFYHNGNTHRVKITLKRGLTNKSLPKKAYSYEAIKIELLKDDLVRFEKRNHNNNSSISIAKLIEGVELFYEKGKLLSEAMQEAGSNNKDKEIVSSLVEQLEKTGLANQVVVDQETFDKKLEELDGKCLHTVYHWKPSLFERRWNCVWFCGRRSCLP